MYCLAEQGRKAAEKSWARASVEVSELIWRNEIEDAWKEEVNKYIAILTNQHAITTTTSTPQVVYVYIYNLFRIIMKLFKMNNYLLFLI